MTTDNQKKFESFVIVIRNQDFLIKNINIYVVTSKIYLIIVYSV